MLIRSLLISFRVVHVNAHIWWVGPMFRDFPLPLFVMPLLRFYRAAGEMAKERATRSAVSYDLWHYILVHDGDAKSLSIAHLARESALSIFAGADTVANS